MRRGYFLLLLIIASVELSGCTALVIGGAAGAGGIAYYQGTLESTLKASISDSTEASKAAVERLRFILDNVTSDAIQARVTAKDSAERTITIDLKHETSSTTAVSIRVGLFGDEHASTLILDEIKKSL